MLRTLIAAVLLVLPIAAAPPKAPQDISGTVVAIQDGDTITILTAEKHEEKIRLNGIDAPEAKQAFGTAAKSALSALVFGKAVLVHVTGHDRYKRTLGRVEVAGVDVNLRMVMDGMAWHFVKYAAKDTALAKAQVEAKAAKRGLWADAEPVPPWEFRKNP
jgi:micrococcal nuclease